MSIFKPMSFKKKMSDVSSPEPKASKASLAMAMAARRSIGKKKMAKGGEISAADESRASTDEKMKRDMEMLEGASSKHSSELDAKDESELANSIDGARDEHEMDMYAKGGIVESIIKKRKMMAEGGEVDLQENGKEDLNNLDDMNYKAARKDTYYDDSQLSSQPEDSNLHGDDLSDEDSHDMVAIIRKKMKSVR